MGSPGPFEPPLVVEEHNVVDVSPIRPPPLTVLCLNWLLREITQPRTVS